MSSQSLIPPPPPEGDEEELDALRRLLLGSDRVQAARLRPHLERFETQELSRILPAAIRLRGSPDQVLTEVLTPTVASSLRTAVKRDPETIAEAIFPVLLPSIRQLIASTFSQFVQSLDAALKYSLSWQSLRWRLEARRTGRTFSEVVLYHTLLYRVEQVFLFHRETGLLLQHVVAPTIAAQNPDLVSAMMTALEDFARDAFGARPEEILREFRVGERSVWVEQGPALFLACVIRGEAPEEFRTAYMVPTLSLIHFELAEELANFDGDPAPFAPAIPRLEAGLQAETRESRSGQSSRPSPPLLILATLVALVLLTWAFFIARDRWRWGRYLERLETEPGLVITERGKRGGRFFVAGLRDPLAADPSEILRRESRLDPEEVELRWRPYQDLSPDFTLRRASSLLAPPSTVRLRFEDGWLVASGLAPRAWTTEARRLARLVPGAAGLREDGLLDEEMVQLEEQIQNRLLRFALGTSQLVAGQQEAVDRQAADLRRLLALAAETNQELRIEIVGHTDGTGTDEINERLSRERAESVRAALIGAGVEATRLAAIGVSNREPVREGDGNPEANRSVTFRFPLGSAVRPRQEKR
jgi:OOP family OmpA-OmpF porin